MSRRIRPVWLALTAAAVLLPSVAGCSVIGLEPTEPLACEGESAPTTAPGEAGVLLTVAEGTSAWDLVTVVYADGVVVRAAGGSSAADVEAAEAAASSASGSSDQSTDSAASSGDPASPWTTGYLLPCAVAELRERAESSLFGSPEFGRVGVPDQEWTYFRYDNGISSASAEVHAYGLGLTEGLEWSERRARDDLDALTEVLRVNLVLTDEPVPVAAVQVDGEMPEGAQLPSTWPGPPATELLGDDGCGVVAEDGAIKAWAYALTDGLGDAGAELHARALPPGVTGCE
ncbi:hypothetical protein [Ruania halotolerans]|uniref:hypothetical protein n=1 Tax=Ruania halotolerans TaxID=2897773 RepID=UPI001E3D83FB|nr:hypothetical protein [Ruania halotolerans]UFU06926.1 hypothetical protein LQF10_02080 [Ruania halotolerans]